jgi:hypothetical protein
MKALIGLELRKQSKTFFGLLFIIAFCLTIVTSSISTFAGLPADESFLSITVMLQVFGIPFFALLLGGGAAAALRSTERKAEEEIPVKPIKRVFASYITSLFYLVILGFILFLASRPFQYSLFLQQDYKIPFVMTAVVVLHSAAFVFSYWLSQALLGSIVSFIAIASPLYFFFLYTQSGGSHRADYVSNALMVLSFYFLPSLIYRHIEYIFIASVILPALIATAANLVILVWLTKKIEREQPTPMSLTIAMAVILISAFSLSIWGTWFSGSISGVTAKELNDTFYLGDVIE